MPRHIVIDTNMDSHAHTCILSSRKASPSPTTIAFLKTSLAQMAPFSVFHKPFFHISL